MACCVVASGGSRAGAPAGVLAELGAAPRGLLCCRQAEAVALVQFSGGPRVRGPGLRVMAGGSAAGHRLATLLRELSIAPAVSVRLTPAGHLVAVDRGGPGIVASLGLLDRRGHRLRGLPTAVIHGRDCDAEAMWRGAVLTAGRLAPPGRTPTLVVACPGPELGLALAGAARRLGATPRTWTPRPAARDDAATGRQVLVVVSGAAAVAALLARIGAPFAAADLVAGRDPRLAGPAPAALAGANAGRAAAAGTRAAEQARADLAALEAGDHADATTEPVPEVLAAAAGLRIAHPDLTLAQLAALSVPPVSKDAYAGRLRQLHILADRRRADQPRCPQ